MRTSQFNWLGLILRFLAALGLVYATWNPEGYSFYHWAMGELPTSAAKSLPPSDALKFLSSVLLLTGWVVFIGATSRSLGMIGVILVAALCAGVIWLAAEMDWFSPEDTQLITHLGLIVAAVILGIGLSWSHISRRLSGQVQVDESE